MPSKAELLPAAFLERLGGVVFDCDGVLIDSIEANAAYYNLFCRHFGRPAMSPSEKRFVHSADVRQSLSHILPDVSWAEIEHFSRTMQYRDVLPDLVLEPGLRELLEALQGLGLRLAVNTNRSDSMHMVLDHFGLHGFFDPVVQASDVPRPKPDPAGLRLILDTWGLPAGEVLFIGDSSVDEATAVAARVPLAAYKNPELTAALTHLPDFPTFREFMLLKKA